MRHVANGSARRGNVNFVPSLGQLAKNISNKMFALPAVSPLPHGALATPQLPAISSALILPCQEGVSFSPLWVPVLPAENHGVRFYPDLWDLGGL
jgi:hypothetical protein